MYDMKALKRIDTYLELLKNKSFSSLLEINEWKRVDCENFKYPKLVSEIKWEETVKTPNFYGKDNTDTWYQTFVAVPDREDIFFNLDLQTDSMVIINDNEKFFAINPFHDLISLDKWRGQTIKITICIWCGYLFPGYHPRETERVLVTVANRVKSYPLTFNTSFLKQKNKKIYDFYYDVYVLRELLNTLDTSSLHYQQVASSLHQALMKITFIQDSTKKLEEEIASASEQVTKLLSYKNATLAPTIYSVGSAHLDQAWLWPQKETLRKAARTLSEMAHLMEKDPTFIFMFSQPYQMKLVKEHYPEIFKEVLKFYKKGQFEPNGVGLVEPDCMLSSGEGQIRNILFGRKLTSQLFSGYYGDTFYVPDSFGYMASLPQILKKSGVEYIVTSKLGWNDTTRHPLDVFKWKGIDGSTIKAHMIQGAYEGTQEPVENLEMWEKVQNKDVQTALFRPVGEGDGGGGTRIEDLELIKRQKDLQGLPKNSWTTMSNAMKNIFTDEVPIFDDELYLELHRGTYTTQAKIKYMHRKLDKHLHNVEYLFALKYVQEKINQEELQQIKNRIDYCWEIFLVNQFHDILPGSSVKIVNDEAKEEYSKAFNEIDKIYDSLITKGEYLLNLSPFTQNGIKPYSSKKSEEENTLSLKVGNNLYSWGSVTLLENGEISSLKVKEREFVSTRFNEIMFGEDFPNNWDAWDIELDDLTQLKKVDGVYRDGKRVITFDNGSRLEQEIIVHKDVARIDFKTKLDWRENHKILRVNFNNTINSDFTTYDIPFGFINRSNKKNSLKDRARFEVVAHEFALQNDNKHIVALMTDSKYGYSAANGQLSTSLIRSPKAPDETADIGLHEFTYSIFITGNDMLKVMEQSANLNNPPLSVSYQIKEDLVEVDKENIIVETVKISENEDSIVVRLRECLGYSAEANIRFNEKLDLSSLEFVNLIEDLVEQGNFVFHPFEIKTIRIKKKS